MAIKRVNAVVEGRVQGVFFRACTSDEAQKLALSGWVKNRPDRSVETEFQGEEAEVSRMVNWLHEGSPMSKVSVVKVSDCEIVDDEQGFRIVY